LLVVIYIHPHDWIIIPDLATACSTGGEKRIWENLLEFGSSTDHIRPPGIDSLKFFLGGQGQLDQSIALLIAILFGLGLEELVASYR